MKLTVKDIAKFFNVTRQTVYYWIENNLIPGYKIHNQYRFDKTEIIKWASAWKLQLSPKIFSGKKVELKNQLSVVEALKAGGIYYNVRGKSKKSVLKNAVDLIRLPKTLDRNFLLEILLAREELASTGIGDGIAFPHVREPLVLNISYYPVTAICFLENPVDYGSLDGKPVDCLFIIVSPTSKVHLYIMSRLSFLLHDPKFKMLIKNRGAKEQILLETKRIEFEINERLKKSRNSSVD